MVAPANPGTWLDKSLLINVASADNTPLPVRSAVRVLAGFTAVDNPTNGTTDLSVTAGATDYTPTLDVTSTTVTPGDTVVSANQTGNANVTRAHSTTLVNSPVPIGIVIAGAGAGGTPTVQTTGTVPASITGLGAGAVAQVAVSLSTGRLYRMIVGGSGTPATLGGESIVGIADAHGNVTVAPRRSVGTGHRMTFNVRDFGAVGDGTADDTAAVQAASDAANAALVSVNAAVVAEMDTGPEVFFPMGTYALKTSEVVVNEFIHLRGDKTATVVGKDASTPIFRIAAYFNKFEGICFAGGKHHVICYGHSAHYGQAMGGPANEGPVDFVDCDFRYSAGPSIYLDTTQISDGGSYPNDHSYGSDAHFQLTRCFGSTATLWHGSAGRLHLNKCTMFWDTTGGVGPALPNDDNGKPLGFINSACDTLVNDCFFVPSTGNNAYAYFNGPLQLRTRDTRYGGESTYNLVRIRNAVPLYGLPLVWPTNHISDVEVQGCDVPGTGTHNWLEIYDQFPASIIYRRGVSMTQAPIGIDLELSSGIWVDSTSCPASTFDSIDITQQRIMIEGTFDYLSQAFWTSAAPGDQTGTAGRVSLFPRLRKYINSYTPANDNRLRNNLHTAGQIDCIAGWSETAAQTVGHAGATDSTLGYTLQPCNSTADGGYFVRENATAWNPTTAGEYTFSVWAKSSAGCGFAIGHNVGAVTTKFALFQESGGGWRRYAYTFYHDGTTAKNFFVGTFRMINASIFTVGLPMVSAGITLSPYAYPVDDPNSPTTNTTATPDLVRGVYYASAAPTGGTFKKGDITINTSPAAGAPEKWICVTAGTPGTWLPTSEIVPPGVTTGSFDFTTTDGSAHLAATISLPLGFHSTTFEVWGEDGTNYSKWTYQDGIYVQTLGSTVSEIGTQTQLDLRQSGSNPLTVTIATNATDSGWHVTVQNSAATNPTKWRIHFANIQAA